MRPKCSWLQFTFFPSQQDRTRGTENCCKEICARDILVESAVTALTKHSSRCKEFGSAEQHLFDPLVFYVSMQCLESEGAHPTPTKIWKFTGALLDLKFPGNKKATWAKLYPCSQQLCLWGIFASLLPSLSSALNSGWAQVLLLCLEPDKPLFCCNTRTQTISSLSAASAFQVSEKPSKCFGHCRQEIGLEKPRTHPFSEMVPLFTESPFFLKGHFK